MAIGTENKDIPDFVKDIKSPNSNIPIDTNFEFVPQNPYTLQGDMRPEGSTSLEIPGSQEKSGFFKTAAAEAYDWNYTAQGLHAGYSAYDKPNPMDDEHAADWNPKTNPDMFYNVRPEYLSYMLDATGPKDQQYRLQRVLAEQSHNDTLANGSWSAKILGGLTGVVTDPISYIPVVGWAKYARFAPTVFKAAAKALPGIATMSVLQSAAKQTDKVNGNLQEFFTDAMVNTVFGSALFGAGGAAGLALDKMELWNLRKLASNYSEGIDFKLVSDETGKLTGFKAVDTTGNLSAAKVSMAQELADSSFSKSGLFKVPYLGDAALKFMSMPILGTPLPKLLTSPFQTVRGFIDRVADHNIITKGVEEGKAATPKFSSLMNQEYAELRGMDAQMTALHLERNGFSTKNRPLGGLINIGLGLKNTALKTIMKDTSDVNYVSKEGFFSEVENVIRNETASEHSSVNEAAAMVREKLDRTYLEYRKANNLPEDWLPPKTAEGYLMRVYDTPYMNSHENEWTTVVGNALREGDAVINSYTQPIKDLEDRISAMEDAHTQLIKRPKVTDEQIKKSGSEISAAKMRKKAMEETLQNELRENPDLHIHVDNWHDLSANEAKEIKALTKPIDDLKREVEAQKKVLAEVKKVGYRKEQATKKARTAVTAKKQMNLAEMSAKDIEIEDNKLRELQNKLDEAEEKLQQQIHEGSVNPRLYNKIPDSQRYALKDPSKRLKFRDTYESDTHRATAAKAYYNTIMNQNAEDTIDQVMGKFTGKESEMPIKQRTLMIPDEVLYKNNFMTKDLMAKVANYSTYLARRTHIKTVFGDLSHEGGLEPLLAELAAENARFRAPLNENLANLKEKLAGEGLSPTEKKAIEKQIKSVEKEIGKKGDEFEAAKRDINHIYKKMMGIKDFSKRAQKIQRGIMSFTAMANLPFVPFTMINDLSNFGMQHGVWPFIRDGVYPMIQSLGGLLKTKDGEALRRAAPSIHLGLQDVGTGYADRNWSMQTNPYVNMGKVVSGLEKLAHFSSNVTLTNYIDNGLQRMAGSVVQSELMRILFEYKAGTMTKKEGLYIRKYGIDPKQWADRMIKAYEDGGGHKTALGGHQSNFWHWSDLEASNHFGDSVFRGVKDTTIQRDIADAPFWADNPLGGLIFGFQGWAFASVNRFVIPGMQQPDALKLVGVLFSLATGAMVDPMRRIAKGEDPVPENQTDKQFAYVAFQNSGVFSWFSNILADANLLSGDRLLGDLKNDRYKDRTRSGLLGPAWGTANRMADIIGALGTNEMNEADAKKMARMLPIANASWTWNMSNKLIESLGLPKTRAQAHARKENE